MSHTVNFTIPLVQRAYYCEQLRALEAEVAQLREQIATNQFRDGGGPIFAVLTPMGQIVTRARALHRTLRADTVDWR